MKQKLFLTLAVFILVASASLAAETNEARLIEVLQSTASSPQQKDEACAQLKLAGTALSVKALAALLTDAQLSHSARYALESMPVPEAGKALLQALPHTTGLLQVGIIDSLGVRGESAATSPLGKLLSHTNALVAGASAEALGRIGGSKALKLLQSAASSSSGSVHDAEVDGILICANKLLDDGKSADALKVFNRLYSTEKTDRARVAAFRGVILASGKDEIKVLTGAIAGTNGPARMVALRLASQVEGAEATKALAELLPKVEVPIQIALVKCFVLRGDPAAMPALVKLADSPDSGVRLAAITALGGLGDDSVVELLAGKAAAGDQTERKAARQSLTELHRGPVTPQLLTLLKTASPNVVAEIFKAIGSRGDQSAVPALLELARGSDEAQRGPAFQALGQLAAADQIPVLVQMVVNAWTDEMRAGAVDALAVVYDRLQTPGRKLDVDAFVKGVETGKIETRLALLPICSELIQEPVRGALHAAITDPDPRIRDAGIRALCETRDGELLPDLLRLACETNQDDSRLPVIRGCVRLATQEESVKLSAARQIETLKQILATPLSAPAKRAVLSGLGAVADPAALAPAEQLLDDPAVKAEAEQAVIRIATAITAAHPAEAGAALKKVLAVTTDLSTRKSADAALSKIH